MPATGIRTSSSLICGSASSRWVPVRSRKLPRSRLRLRRREFRLRLPPSRSLRLSFARLSLLRLSSSGCRCGRGCRRSRLSPVAALVVALVARRSRLSRSSRFSLVDLRLSSRLSATARGVVALVGVALLARPRARGGGLRLGPGAAGLVASSVAVGVAARGGAPASGLRGADGLDESAFAHRTGALDAQASGELLELGQEHPVAGPPTSCASAWSLKRPGPRRQGWLRMFRSREVLPTSGACQMDGAGLEVNLAQMIGFDAFSRRSVCGTRGNLYERGC